MSEVLLEIFPNEMMASFWADVLRDDGIPSLVKPQLGGYGIFGQAALMHHGLYVLEEHLAQAREVLDGTPIDEDAPEASG